ncbi:MAG: MlaD family protein [Bacteroidetes bacterium]|nr:MlaD family protein [Bacteroidota bacterium]
MRDQRRTDIKVGITVVAGLFIFLWILGWAKNITVNANRKEISVEFGSVAGLTVGDPVMINGVRKGYVDDINLTGNVVMTKLNLDGDIALKEDAKFSVMMLDLMGGKKVEIYPGNSNLAMDYAKTQRGEFVGDVATSMAMLGSVQNDLVDVIKQVKISLNAVNQTLTDQKFNKDLKTSVANLSGVTENLNLLLKNNNAEINRILKSGNELTKNINDFIKTNRDSISATISSIHDVLVTSKDLLTKVNTFMDQTNASQNNLGKFLNDKDLMNDLKATIGQVKDLTKILVEQLKSKGVEVNAHIF